MTIAALEARRGPLSLQEHGGSFARTPRMAVAFLFLGFSSVALPLTLGFVAEDLLVQGSIDEFPQIGLAVICATALNGVNVMRCFFVLFSGTRRHIGEHDLTRREAGALTTVMGILLLGGLAPRVFLGASAIESNSAHPTHPAHSTQQGQSTHPPR
jgi:NADH-quinone oxidoreductase subunit M